MARTAYLMMLGGVAAAAVALQAAPPTRTAAAGAAAPAEWPAFRGPSEGIAPALPVRDAKQIKLNKRW